MKIKGGNGFNKRLVSISCIFLIFIALLDIVTVTADDPFNTPVYVNPSDQIVSPEDSFTVSVYCDPDQPIKSFEFKLSFDSSLVEADSVSEGDIFDGYSTFFNSGTIDNDAGTIIDIYGLILGSGNVIGSGSFAEISFTAKDSSGTSSINIYDVGVTNETAYVTITTTNGSVQIDGVAPEITDNSPSQGTTGDSFTFSVSVTDNIDTAGNLLVYVDWSHGSSSGNNSMSNVGGDNFEKTVTLDQNSVSDLTYTIYAEDSYGNGHATSSSSVSVSDNDAPGISSITATPDTQEVGYSVSISADVIDNIGVNDVYLHITYPDSSSENTSITANVAGDTYYLDQVYNQYGTHSYFFWADDGSSNAITSATNTFEIGDFSPPTISDVQIATSSPLDTDPTLGWVNITCHVVDNVVVNSVYLKISNPDGSWNNISMNPAGSDDYYVNSSTAFSDFGNFSYFIWADDNDLNAESSSSADFSMPPNYDVNMDGLQNILDLIAVSNHYDETGDAGWIREDVDNNGIIQIYDFVLISNNYGEVWWV